MGRLASKRKVKAIDPFSKRAGKTGKRTAANGAALNLKPNAAEMHLPPHARAALGLPPAPAPVAASKKPARPSAASKPAAAGQKRSRPQQAEQQLPPAVQPEPELPVPQPAAATPRQTHNEASKAIAEAARAHINAATRRPGESLTAFKFRVQNEAKNAIRASHRSVVRVSDRRKAYYERKAAGRAARKEAARAHDMDRPVRADTPAFGEQADAPPAGLALPRGAKKVEPAPIGSKSLAAAMLTGQTKRGHAAASAGTDESEATAQARAAYARVKQQRRVKANLAAAASGQRVVPHASL